MCQCSNQETWSLLFLFDFTVFGSSGYRITLWSMLLPLLLLQSHDPRRNLTSRWSHSVGYVPKERHIFFSVERYRFTASSRSPWSTYNNGSINNDYLPRCIHKKSIKATQEVDTYQSCGCTQKQNPGSHSWSRSWSLWNPYL